MRLKSRSIGVVGKAVGEDGGLTFKKTSKLAVVSDIGIIFKTIKICPAASLICF